MQRRSQSTNRKLISIIIPTLNEESGIEQVLRLIPYRDLEQVEVIVIDGGSSDGTPEIAKSLGVCVVPQKRPGYSQAIIEGLSYAKGEILVFVDGDAVYDPREIPALIRVMNEEKADLVIGSRFRGEVKPGAIPKVRLFANKLLNIMASRLLGTRITDAFSGFIVARKMVVSKLAELSEPIPTPVQYAIIAEVYKKQGKIVEAPVTFYPRIGRYKLNPVLHGFRILLTILKTTLGGGLSS